VRVRQNSEKSAFIRSFKDKKKHDGGWGQRVFTHTKGRLFFDAALFIGLIQP
jgi:hypothetical protein